jgi:hypothetical protein
MTLNPKQLLILTFLLITIPSVFPWSTLPQFMGNTTVMWILFSCFLFLILKIKNTQFNFENNKIIIPIKLYLIWNIVCIIRGAFIAEDYWEWKNLTSTGMTLLLPLTIYISTNKLLLQQLTSYWLRYALPAFFIFLPFLYSDAVGRYLIPIMFLLLFLPVLPNKWKFIILFFTIIVFIAGLEARSNVIKFSIALLFGLSFYFRKFLNSNLFKFAGSVFLFLPFLLLFLAITDTFNVFKMDEYIKGDYTISPTNTGETDEQSLTADTRTGLYGEVIGSAIENNYVVWGRTPARGYTSESMGEFINDVLKTDKSERSGSEVSILNIFTYTGIVGVVLYFFVFFEATFLAIFRSNNFFMQIVGLFVAFRWTYAFVEDFTDFDLSYIFLWFLIGMCYSKEFRRMNNNEFIHWVKGIVDKQFRISQNTRIRITS